MAGNHAESALAPPALRKDEAHQTRVDLLGANIENTNMKTKKLGKVERTSLGFEVVNFKDHYGTPCSLQASSLAIYEKPGTSAIWLGVDDASPQCLHGDAARLGIKTDATCGWVKYPLSDKVMLTTRMHLHREQVEALIPMLQSWLKRDTFKVKAST